jgi:DNA repair exonuclease SbcCD ATPase subunit
MEAISSVDQPVSSPDIDQTLLERLQRSDHDLLQATRDLIALRTQKYQYEHDSVILNQQLTDLKQSLKRQHATFQLEIRRAQAEALSKSLELSKLKDEEIEKYRQQISNLQTLCQTQKMKMSTLQKETRMLHSQQAGWAYDVATLRRRLEAAERAIRSLNIRLRIDSVKKDDKLDRALRRNGCKVSKKGNMGGETADEGQIAELLACVRVALEQLEDQLPPEEELNTVGNEVDDININIKQ